MATISIILTSYNYARYLAEAIDSLLGQTFSDFELIIIDNCSNDGSQELIKQYAEKDGRIRARFHDANMGIAYSCNEGLDMAQCDYIAFATADDIYLPHWLERSMEVMLREGAVVVHGEALIIDADGRKTGGTFSEHYGAVQKVKNGSLFDELLNANYPNVSTFVMRREHVPRLDESAQRYLDYPWTVELSILYPFVFIEDPVMHYRIHSKNATQTDFPGWAREEAYVNKLLLEKYRERLSPQQEALLMAKIGAAYSRFPSFGNYSNALRFLYHAAASIPTDTRLIARIIDLECRFDRPELPWQTSSLRRLSAGRLSWLGGQQGSENTADKTPEGMLAEAAGDREEALRLYRKAAEMGGGLIPLLNSGLLLIDLGRAQEALDVLGEASQKHDEDSGITSGRAIALAELGRDEEALACFDKAVGLDERDTGVLLNRGVFLARHSRHFEDAHRHDEAAQCFARVTDLDPDNQIAHRYLASSLEALNKPEDALAVLEQSAALSDVSAGFWTCRGITLAKLERFDLALECFEAACAAEPGSIPALMNKGKCLVQLKKHAQAVSCYDGVLARHPRDEVALTSKGAALLAAGQHEEALVSLSKAMELGGSVETLLLIARALASKGDLEGSLHSYREASTLDPTCADAWLGQVEALASLGAVEEALHCLERDLEIDPLDSNAWALKAAVLEDMGLTEEAIACLGRSLVADGTNVEALIAKGRLLHAVDNNEEALASFSAALELCPGEPGLWTTVGAVLLLLGRAKEAASCYEKATALDPGDALAWLNRGIAEEESGAAGIAIGSFERFLELEASDYPEEATHARGRIAELGEGAGGVTLEPSFVQAGRSTNGGKVEASLVWPAFEDFSGLDSSWIPHGIAQIATEANLRGHAVDILDGRTLKADGVKKALSESDIEVVGISVLSSLVGFAEDVVDFLSKYKPDIKIVLGGIHPTVCPEDFSDWPYTWLVQGEGEETFCELLEGKFEPGILQGKPPSLPLLSSVDRGLLRVEEQPFWETKKPFATVIIGRGCPYSCTFCQPAERILFGKRLRVRPVANVVEELKSLGVKSFMVHDDCFTSMKSYVLEFCEAIQGLDMEWWCQGRADNVVDNPDMVRKMRDSGLVGMILGHESGDDRVLEAIDKGTTVEQNIESAARLKALGINVWSNIMIGLPVEIEPPSAVLNTIKMVKTMQPAVISLCAFTPHPGSKLFDYCVENDLILRHPGDWTYYNRGQFEPKIKGPDYHFLTWAAQEIYSQQS